MGRLDDIIDRNKNPRKHGKTRVPWSILMAAFVLLILVLMIFTDLDESPVDKKPPPTPSLQPGEKHVDGVLLYRPRARRDAGVDQQPSAPGSASAR